MDLVNENKPDQLIGTDTDPETISEINTPSGRKVCIGGSCKSVTLAGGLFSILAKPEPIEGPFNDPAGAIVVERSLIYADENKVNKFLEALWTEEKSSGKKITQQQFMNRLQNYELGDIYGETIIQRELDIVDVDKSINKLISEAGFSQSQINEINQFKSKIFGGLKKIPEKTKILLNTKKEGSSTIGKIDILIPGKNPESLAIGEGDKVRRMILTDIKTKYWTSEFLWEKYNDPNTQLRTIDN